MIPVTEGQWREGGGLIWAVLEPSPRRPGFWLCVSDQFPYELAAVGRRELEAMRLVSRHYYGEAQPHLGEQYVRAFRSAVMELADIAIGNEQK